MKQPLPPCIKVVQIDYRFCAGPLYCTEFSSYWKTNQAGSYLIDRELSGNCVWPLYWKDIFCPLSQTIDVYGPFIAPESQAAIMFKSAFFWSCTLCSNCKWFTLTETKRELSSPLPSLSRAIQSASLDPQNFMLLKSQ